jgi:hypothetical protein
MNNKTFEWIAGLWLFLNFPIIPFVGSVFYLLTPGLHLILAIAVLIVFIVLSKRLSVSVAASLAVVLIAVLRFEQTKDYIRLLLN